MVNYLWDNLFKRTQREQEIDAVLRENYIFKVLTKVELLFLRDLLHTRVYRAGEIIFNQGESGVGMYVVIKGSVNITVEDLHVKEPSERMSFITRLGKGDFFGELALVEQGGRFTATATAADEVILLGFFKPDLAELTERSPRIGNKILTRLAEVLGRRLRETAERFSEVKRELKEISKNNAGG